MPCSGHVSDGLARPAHRRPDTGRYFGRARERRTAGGSSRALGGRRRCRRRRRRAGLRRTRIRVSRRNRARVRRWSGRRDPRVALTFGSRKARESRGKPRRRGVVGPHGSCSRGLWAASEGARRRRACSRDVASLTAPRTSLQARSRASSRSPLRPRPVGVGVRIRLDHRCAPLAFLSMRVPPSRPLRDERARARDDGERLRGARDRHVEPLDREMVRLPEEHGVVELEALHE